MTKDELLNLARTRAPRQKQAAVREIAGHGMRREMAQGEIVAHAMQDVTAWGMFHKRSPSSGWGSWVDGTKRCPLPVDDLHAVIARASARDKFTLF